MKRTSPPDFELGSTEPVWVRPGEDVRLWIGFDESVISDIDFELVIKEHNWPHMPASYEVIDKIVIDDQNEFTEEKYTSVDYRVFVTIPKETINTLIDRTLDLRVNGVQDGRTWTIIDDTLVVAQGD